VRPRPQGPRLQGARGDDGNEFLNIEIRIMFLTNIIVVIVRGRMTAFSWASLYWMDRSIINAVLILQPVSQRASQQSPFRCRLKEWWTRWWDLSTAFWQICGQLCWTVIISSVWHFRAAVLIWIMQVLSWNHCVMLRHCANSSTSLKRMARRWVDALNTRKTQTGNEDALSNWNGSNGNLQTQTRICHLKTSFAPACF